MWHGISRNKNRSGFPPPGLGSTRRDAATCTIVPYHAEPPNHLRVKGTPNEHVPPVGDAACFRPVSTSPRGAEALSAALFAQVRERSPVSYPGYLGGKRKTQRSSAARPKFPVPGSAIPPGWEMTTQTGKPSLAGWGENRWRTPAGLPPGRWKSLCLSLSQITLHIRTKPQAQGFQQKHKLLVSGYFHRGA